MELAVFPLHALVVDRRSRCWVGWPVLISGLLRLLNDRSIKICLRGCGFLDLAAHVLRISLRIHPVDLLLVWIAFPCFIERKLMLSVFGSLAFHVPFASEGHF